MIDHVPKVDQIHNSKQMAEEYDTLDMMEASRQQAMNATMPNVKEQRNMGPQHTVASRMKAFAAKVLHTPDNAEPALKLNDQKHKSAYQKKKDKRKIKHKILAMDEVFLEQGKVEESDFQSRIDKVFDEQEEDKDKDEESVSPFRIVLDNQTVDVWNKLTTEERDSITAYTADHRTAKGMPYFKTMNGILRKGLYEEGKGIDMQLKEGGKDVVVEKSKQNFDAVTDCINALKKSALPHDMVCRRGTDLQTLLCMLGNDEASIRKNINKYNEGNTIIFDRGFLSTSPFPNAGLPGKVEWRIQGHAGDEALFIGKKSHFPIEGEMLFQAGTRFRLLKICPPRTEEQPWKVYMETASELKPLRGKDK